MGHDVYANNMLISAKCADGKSPAAFPDPCMTPPPPPGVPVPYPNTSFSSDLTNGSKTVKIGRTEVALKNKSYYKTSTGNEAGCAPKKGVMSSVIKGKTYFTSWSMNVKIEGLNVVRHMDTATHNHGSTPNTPPWPYLDKMTVPPAEGNCKKNVEDEKTACKDHEPYKKVEEGGLPACPGSLANPPGKLSKAAVKEHADKATKDAAKDGCVKARKCQLTAYDAEKDGIQGCCPGQTPHHVVPKSSFYKTSVKAGVKCIGAEDYDPMKAPCICLEGTNNTMGSHGDGHQAHRRAGREAGFKKGELHPLSEHAVVCADSMKEVAPHCQPECIEEQIKEGHRQAGVKGDPKIKHSPSGKTESTAADRAGADSALPSIDTP